jgi:hypothetical protein
MRRALVLVVLASCITVGLERSAHACTCVPLTDLRDVLGRSDGAFVGTLLGSSIDKTQQRSAYASYEFRVTAVYNGRFAREVVVRSGRDSAACAIAAREGDRVGLFLEREGDVWTSNSCSQVSAAEMRGTGVRASAPLDPRDAPPPEGANAIPVEALWALAAALLVLTVALTLARDRWAR